MKFAATPAKLLYTFMGIVLIASLLACPNTSATRFKSNIPDIGQGGDWVIDVQQERTMGNMLIQQIRGADYIHPDPVVNDYLRELALKLQAASGHTDHKLHFFCVNNDELNAFAFFGGHVAVHSALIIATESESELAAVLSHETAHIAQHHLARILTSNKKMMALTLAELVAAFAIGMGSPEAGMHLATAALGGHIQQLINYTNSHEKEADRIGIQILHKAGFDPHAMPAIFHKLQSKTQYATKPPEYLLTHPMYEDRVADTENRADKLSYQKPPENLNFHLMRSRLVLGNQENAKRRVQRLHKLLEADRHPDKSPLEYV
jgi:beta-barrel assembly-enhancing protease